MSKDNIYVEHLNSFSSEYLTEYGYNKCYYELKKYIEMPSLYEVASIIVLHFLMYNDGNQFPNDAYIKSLLKECRKVNKLIIELSNDGSWDKQLLFKHIK